MAYITRVLRQGGPLVWALIGIVMGAIVVSGITLNDTLRQRFRRDVMRMAFNGNLELLDDVKREIGATRDTPTRRLGTSDSAGPGDRPYIVVSISDKRLWYRQGDRTNLHHARGHGDGEELVKEGPNGGVHWKFDTPRGRLVVEAKETDPVWVPPDWHYVEMASKKHLGVVKLMRGKSIPIGGGAVVTVDGTDVVTKYPDGRKVPFETSEGKEIVANDSIVIPRTAPISASTKGRWGSIACISGTATAFTAPTSLQRSEPLPATAACACATKTLRRSSVSCRSALWVYMYQSRMSLRILLALPADWEPPGYRWEPVRAHRRLGIPPA